MKAIHVAFTTTLLVAGLTRSNCRGQALSEKEYLSAVLPQELMRFAGIEVPSRENIQVLSDAVGKYLEFRLVPGQAKKNNGIRAEISVNYPYSVGDIVRYKWEMRLPKDFEADEPPGFHVHGADPLAFTKAPNLCHCGFAQACSAEGRPDIEVIHHRAQPAISHSVTERHYHIPNIFGMPGAFLGLAFFERGCGAIR